MQSWSPKGIKMCLIHSFQNIYPRLNETAMSCSKNLWLIIIIHFRAHIVLIYPHSQTLAYKNTCISPFWHEFCVVKYYQQGSLTGGFNRLSWIGHDSSNQKVELLCICVCLWMSVIILWTKCFCLLVLAEASKSSYSVVLIKTNHQLN